MSGSARGAVVLSMDEKPHDQALDRIRPLLPMTLGVSEKRTHDCVHHGFFAALNVETDEVIGRRNL